MRKATWRTGLEDWGVLSAFPDWSTSNSSPLAQAYGLADRLIMEETMPRPVRYRIDGYLVATKFHDACCTVPSRHLQQEELISLDAWSLGARFCPVGDNTP